MDPRFETLEACPKAKNPRSLGKATFRNLTGSLQNFAQASTMPLAMSAFTSPTSMRSSLVSPELETPKPSPNCPHPPYMIDGFRALPPPSPERLIMPDCTTSHVRERQEQPFGIGVGRSVQLSESARLGLAPQRQPTRNWEDDEGQSCGWEACRLTA